MSTDPYRSLALRLDALPNGYPATADGAELRLLAKLYTPAEAALAAELRMTLETGAEIAARTGRPASELSQQLRAMRRKGLIKAGRTPGGLGYGLLPFVVGIYENQGSTMDAELARLFEDYYGRTFAQVMTVQPEVHRVIPVHQTIRVDMEVRPYESAAEIVAASRSWGVTDCICRKQRALIGEACGHPVDVCMVMSPMADAFAGAEDVRALTQEGAMATLHMAAEAGLVHQVSNSQDGGWYICNCCTCSCGVLRAIAQLGIANVVARSAFVNTVDKAACIACGLCIDACQFGALSLAETTIVVDRGRCLGCGVCVLACPQDALGLVRRPEDEVLAPPATDAAWMAARAEARGLDINAVL